MIEQMNPINYTIMAVFLTLSMLYAIPSISFNTWHEILNNAIKIRDRLFISKDIKSGKFVEIDLRQER